MFRTLTLATLMACATENPAYPPAQSDLPADITSCTADEDCMPVELGCCDSCNGGTRVAVRADTPDATLDDWRETCGNGTACTEIGCALAPAVCSEAGSCELGVAPPL